METMSALETCLQQNKAAMLRRHSKKLNLKVQVKQKGRSNNKQVKLNLPTNDLQLEKTVSLVLKLSGI